MQPVIDIFLSFNVQFPVVLWLRADKNNADYTYSAAELWWNCFRVQCPNQPRTVASEENNIIYNVMWPK